MKPKVILPIITALILLLVAVVWWLYPTQQVNAQCTTPSSCKTCHEVQGQKPVNDANIWHQQHAIFDFCEACHGGDRLAEDSVTAHLGTRTTLQEMSPTCKSCHPADLETCLRTYATDLGFGDDEFGLILETASSSPVGGASVLDQLSSGSLVGPQVPSGTSESTNQPSKVDFGNPTNIVLLVLLLIGLVGGTGYVIWNERRMRMQQKETLAVLSRFVGFVRRENWTPYAAGVLLGITGILAVLIGRHLLTASGPVATIASSIYSAIFPAQVEGNVYFRFVVPPELSWPVILFAGIFFGGMLGAITSGTFKLRWNDDPIWRKIFGRAAWKRIVVGFIGAILLQYGASIAGGCTSGLAISGGMLLTPSAFLFMAGMFASGIVTAWLVFRRKY